MAGTEPLLTVAIPTFNCAHFLPDAIASVMRQGLDDFELLILDNASEDNTEDVVRSFENARIRYIRNPSNLGACENGNRCLANSRGRYFKMLCADDVLLDGVLRKQLNILQTQQDVAVVTCGYLETDPALKIQRSWSAFPGSHPGSRVINFCLSRMANAVGGPSNIMVRRTAADGIMGDASYRLLGDLKFSLQLLQRGRYVSLNEPGYLYRRHPNGDFVTNCTDELHVLEYLRLVSEFNWWNPLNCLLASLRGGNEGRRAVREHWRGACAPARLARSLEACADFLYKRTLQLFDGRKAGPVQSAEDA
ncbi:MAG TPA: glycosyltransferase family A protein [Candidatus Sulfotelmatobacter sp.]|nr:glycosyltransferase family A protein [Candidatus Sulfotelmatobacter sp.]